MRKRQVRTDENGFIKNAKIKGVHDETLIHREIYNPNNFELIFTRNKLQDQYILKSNIPLGPEIAICKAQGFLHLPHGYYFAKASNGADIFNAVVNYGEMIGTGNKLPSLPIFEGSMRRK